MRIVFMGTPDFAVPALRKLHEEGHEIAAVYCQPPRPAGRGKKLQPTPVHVCTEELGLSVHHPLSLKGEDEKAAFAALGADVAVVAAYGLILPEEVLNAPKHGCLNIHASLLPRWRGAAPIHRAIMAGDEETGVTIMQMERGLDTGPMLAKVRVPIGAKTTGELTAELAELGADLMARSLADLASLKPEMQDEALVTYAAKIDKAEAHLDFARPAVDIVRQIHALAPFPGAWVEMNGERIKFLAAELVPAAAPAPAQVLDDRFLIGCREGAIRPLRLQKAGKPAMGLDEFLRGSPIPKGTRLT